MALAKRIFLFLVTNIAILFLINIILIVLSRFFGIQISGYGLNFVSLGIFSLVVGFSGAFISLFMSRWLAKKSHGIQLFSQEDFPKLSSKEKLVYDTVLNISNKHGIKIPEVGIYNSPDVNAFATGATKNSSLVAVSTGLLAQMNEIEIEAVVAHEMAHILNGDMVTMTLLQGIMNTFVVFFSRVVANIADSFFSKGENNGPTFVYYIVSIVFEILFGVLASLVVNAFSRHREFRADAGSANFVGKEKMIAALKALQRIHMPIESDPKLATAMIRGKEPTGFMKLFMTHPALEKRIEYLEQLQF